MLVSNDDDDANACYNIDTDTKRKDKENGYIL